MESVKDRLKKIRNYDFVIISVYIILFISSLSIVILSLVKTIQFSIEKLSETISERMTEILMETHIANFSKIYEITLKAKDVAEKSKDNLEEFLSKHLDSKVFVDINYYFISKEGIIYESDYEQDVGLDLRKIPGNFWNYTLKKIRQDRVFVDMVHVEHVSGKPRIFSYSLMRNGSVFELGFLLNQGIFRDVSLVFDELRKNWLLSLFLHIAGVYSYNNKPVFENLPQISDHPSFLVYRYRKLVKLSLQNNSLNTGGFHNGLIGNSMREDLGRIFVVLEFNFLPVLSLLFALAGIFTLLTYFRTRFLYSFVSELKDNIVKIGDMASSISSYSINDFIIKSPAFSFKEMEDVSFTLINSQREIIKYINDLRLAHMKISLLNKELESAYLSFSSKIALIAEGFDYSTSRHMSRVYFLTRFIQEELGIDNKEIYLYSGLHDIGKIFVPKAILVKREPLTRNEWEEVKKHTIYAKRLLDHPRFKVALNIAMYHHENFDGTGYPDRLKGEKIPIEARIVKICDVYDALRDSRPYKNPYPHEVAMEIMKKGDDRVKLSHFDPEVFRAFLNIEDKIFHFYERISEFDLKF